MKLIDIAAGYDEAEEKLTRRIGMLREKEKTCPAEMSAAETVELANLIHVRKEVRKLGELCRHYYERSFYRNEDYLCSRRPRRTACVSGGASERNSGWKPGSDGKAAPKPGFSNPERTDREAAGNLIAVLFRGVEHAGDR